MEQLIDVGLGIELAVHIFIFPVQCCLDGICNSHLDHFEFRLPRPKVNMAFAQLSR